VSDGNPKRDPFRERVSLARWTVAAITFAVIVFALSALIAIKARAQATIDCRAGDEVNDTLYFYGRSTYRFCVPRMDEPWVTGFDTWHWQIHYAHRTEWETLATTLMPEVSVTVPEWSRFEVRYEVCRGVDLCREWSLPSAMVVSAPSLDLDSSGGITIGEVLRVCRDVVYPLLGRRLEGGEYR
jgi:hypothetical protein